MGTIFVEYEGTLDATGMRIAIVAGRFNDHITKPLLEGALGARCTTPASTTCRCTGCRARSRSRWSRSGWRRRARATRSICLGAVIRGDTPHFDFVAGECAAGIARVSLDTGVPVRLRGAHHRRPRPGPRPLRRSCRGRHLLQQGRRSRPHTAVEMVDLLRKLPAVRTSREEAPDAPPRPPEGFARDAPRCAVRRRRPRRVAWLRRRLPGDDRRSPRRRGAHPAPAGDPALRRRRHVRRRHHRA